MFHKLFFSQPHLGTTAVPRNMRKPLPPAGVRDVAASRIPFTPVIRPKLAEGPQRLQQRLMMEIGLAPQDALAYIQRRFGVLCVIKCVLAWVVCVKYHLVVHDFKPQAF